MPFFLFYFLSFLEGASVMAAELLGARMLAPYFGSSLYVWASVLGITLGGLAMGYFAGGIISQRKNTEQKLYFILLASAVFLMIMPGMAKEVMVHTPRFSLLVSIVISTLIFLFPPVFFMGMVSPMIVGCVASSPSPILPFSDSESESGRAGETGQRERAGKAAGTVYAISTVGGILSTFLLGFYFIPNFGLTKPAIVMGIILGIIPFIKLVTAKKAGTRHVVSLLIFLVAALSVIEISFSSSSSPSVNSNIKILYSSEGLLGQIMVADYPLYEEGKKVEGFQRVLFVNRSTQTIVTHKNGKKSFFDYVNVIMEIAPSLKGEELLSPFRDLGLAPRALVLGLGGGCVANELIKNGFDVDAIELDERMADAAKKHFELDEKVNVTIDDARHFIRSHYSLLTTHYSVVVLDAFIGEVNPHHLFTQEFFTEIKSILSDSGIFFINGNGYWNGEAGKGMRSVCKTLINSDFDVEVVPTGEEEDYRNLVFVARPASFPRFSVSPVLRFRNGETGKGRIGEADDLEGAVILTDEKPQLEILNALANKRWREMCMKYFLNGYYSGQDVLLFK